MRRAVGCVLVCGCADLIGADFGDASLASDAGFEAAPFEAAADVAPPLDAALPFDPSSLPDLVLWLDATTGVILDDAGTAAVARWTDRSGSGHDAVPTGFANTSAPTAVPSAMNGLAVVHFSSLSGQMLQASSWLGPGGTELTMFLVTRGYATSALRFQSDIRYPPYVILPLDVSGEPDAASFAFLESRVNDAGMATQGVSIHTLSGEGPEMLTARWSKDGSAAIYRDGMLVGLLQGLDPTLPSEHLFIGGVEYPGVGGAAIMNADVAEALVYSVALDDVARAEVEGYLRKKWGL